MVDITPSQMAYAQDFPNQGEFVRACERGRLMAAEALRINPAKRAKMEQRYGETYCRNRWPEAYKRS